MNHIFPDKEIFIKKEFKESMLNQSGKVFWFTGLSGSGKSTIASSFEKLLHEKNYYTVVLDGDNIRNGINSNLGFSENDRFENIRRIAEIAKLFVENGAVVICCFISPTHELRKLAQEIIGEPFVEIFINTPLEICEKRDVKGLYAKARKGEIKDFTGISAPFENPSNPYLILNTENNTIEQNTMDLFLNIKKLIERP